MGLTLSAVVIVLRDIAPAGHAHNFTQARARVVSQSSVARSAEPLARFSVIELLTDHSVPDAKRATRGRQVVSCPFGVQFDVSLAHESVDEVLVT